MCGRIRRSIKLTVLDGSDELLEGVVADRHAEDSVLMQPCTMTCPYVSKHNRIKSKTNRIKLNSIKNKTYQKTKTKTKQIHTRIQYVLLCFLRALRAAGASLSSR